MFPQIIGLSRLADDDRAGTDDEDGGNVGAAGHWFQLIPAVKLIEIEWLCRRRRAPSPRPSLRWGEGVLGPRRFKALSPGGRGLGEGVLRWEVSA
jgi:hypothetical protein